jgi:hypothetical protein
MVASYTAPDPTEAVGGPVTAADWNTYVRDNMDAMVNWVSYTPALTQGAAVAKTTTYAKYRKFGTTCHVVVFLTSTAAGTTSQNIVVGLPSGATASTTNQVGIGSGIFQLLSATAYPCVAILNTTTSIAFYRTDINPGNFVGNDPAAAMVSGTTIKFEAHYETT